MGPPISKELQLVSFHTVSKGFLGECGQRGGYFEMTNIPPEVYLLFEIFIFISQPPFGARVVANCSCIIINFCF